MTTELFLKQQAAEAAYKADDMNLDLLRASDAAFAAYNTALKQLREEFNALPDSDRKDSAITNAYDTEGTDEDELYWFEIALGTYETLS